MSQQNKIHADTATAFALRQAALRRGTSASDVLRKLVQEHLEAPKGDVAIETNKRVGRVSAAYLSDTLSDAVQRLAAQSGCSQSWVIRDLLRSELKNRGLLPPASATIERV